MSAQETLAKCTLRSWLRRELGWTELKEALAELSLSEERLSELSRECELELR